MSGAEASVASKTQAAKENSWKEYTCMYSVFSYISRLDMSGSFNMFMMFRSRTAWFTFVVKTLGALLEINTGYQIQVKTVGAHGLAKLISSFVGGIKVH